MDGSTVEHSDSDSGESWTLLENAHTCSDGTPDYPENAAIPSERENVETHSEKDEDTDGISIISDSDPESAPCDVSYVKLPTEEARPVEQDIPLLDSSPLTNINHNNESIRDETDFLGDKVKLKTYVHRRNPKVGTILDIIMLGTFIITAGMALGHLWSCKNECTTQTSVNKVLSNLYKLQEENAYLRNKLKEITETSSNQLGQQRKPMNLKLATKQHRCKKIFEEPIIKNDNVALAVKCVNDIKPDAKLHDPLGTPEHEKEFLNDINKMKNIYNQNKNWIDKEVKKQFENYAKSNTFNDAKPESDSPINLKKQLGPIIMPHTDDSDAIQNTKTESNKVKSHRQINLESQLGPTYYEIPLNTPDNKEAGKTKDVVKPHKQINLEVQIGPNQYPSPPNPEDVQSEPFEMLPEKKITYADSLKIDQPLQRSRRSENNDMPSRWTKDLAGKRKHKDDDVLLNLNSFSEDDIKKDDRYTGPKMKHEKKKHDRQKSHKKQKRNNKYEQWEMKGGYLRDFDEFSVTSSQDNDIMLNNPEKKFLNAEFENYINKFIESENNSSNKDLPKINKKNEKINKMEKRSMKGEKRKKGRDMDSEWYDQRSALRAEARMKLEHELFGENTSNNAAWYFRRMQKREQCRAQKDNSTFKKFSKRKMNFKMKR